MVFGGISRERLQLNESTIWTGRPRDYAHPGAVKYLEPIRERLQEMRTCERKGDLKEAKAWQTKAEVLALKEFMSIPLRLTSYEPICCSIFLYQSLRTSCSLYTSMTVTIVR